MLPLWASPQNTSGDLISKNLHQDHIKIMNLSSRYCKLRLQTSVLALHLKSFFFSKIPSSRSQLHTALQKNGLAKPQHQKKIKPFEPLSVQVFAYLELGLQQKPNHLM